LPEQLCQTYGNKAGRREGERGSMPHQPNGMQSDRNSTYVKLQTLTTKAAAKENYVSQIH